MVIPNIVPQVIVLLFYIIAVFFEAPVTMIFGNTLCATVVLVVMFSYFARGFIGGGGGKLIAALSIWLGYTKALAFFFILSVTFYLAAIPLGIVGCFLLKKNRPKAMPILPVVVCAFLAVLPMSQIYSHISQGFEVSITSSQPTGIIPQPAPPEIGISPLRKTIAPSFKSVSEAIPSQTNGLIGKDEAK